jgi:hypothetical protein
MWVRGNRGFVIVEFWKRNICGRWNADKGNGLLLLFLMVSTLWSQRGGKQAGRSGGEKSESV